MITYNDYPFLLFFSQDLHTSFNELTFLTPCEEANQFLSNSKGWHEMFNFATAMNTLNKKDASTNYFVTPETLDLYHNDKKFRYYQFHDFCKSDIKSQFGTLLFPNGGQFVYVVMGKPETRVVKNLNDNYLCAAKFQRNLFIGFEEGRIIQESLDDMPTSYFSDGSTNGSYLAFVIICLAYAQKQIPLKQYNTQTVKETIYIL